MGFFTWKMDFGAKQDVSVDETYIGAINMEVHGESFLAKAHEDRLRGILLVWQLVSATTNGALLGQVLQVHKIHVMCLSIFSLVLVRLVKLIVV